MTYTSNRERNVDPNSYTGTQLFEVMRTWHVGFSSARHEMATFHDLFSEMKSNPKFVDTLSRFANKIDESKEDGDKIITKTSLSPGNYICDARSNLIEISSLKHRNSYIINHKSTSLDIEDGSATTALEECLAY